MQKVYLNRVKPLKINTKNLLLLLLCLTLVDASITFAKLILQPNEALVEAAKSQIGVTVSYDSSYQRLPYPNGDVPLSRGVCTDVIIRAYRAQDVDLQQLVHEDMRVARKKYPNKWGLKKLDSNIDHRRVDNLAVFFKRHAKTILASKQANDYQAGDIVTWLLSPGVPHIGLVGDQLAADGTPLVIHNIGRGTKMDNSLFLYKITGHFRYSPS